MKKTVVLPLLLFMGVMMFAVTVGVSDAAIKGRTDAGEVDPGGFLDLNFGEDKKTIEKKLVDKGFNVTFSTENNTDIIRCLNQEVLGRKAEQLTCFFTEDHLMTIGIIWSSIYAPPGLVNLLRGKYGIEDNIANSDDTQKWYVGDTMILFSSAPKGENIALLMYCSISLNEAVIDKKNRDIMDSL
jgi:hypothetical protein